MGHNVFWPSWVYWSLINSLLALTVFKKRHYDDFTSFLCLIPDKTVKNNNYYFISFFYPPSSYNPLNFLQIERGCFIFCFILHIRTKSSSVYQLDRNDDRCDRSKSLVFYHFFIFTVLDVSTV
jgi:hypothetical protein